MIASDELYTLIKGLTPNEKRYFKVWASKHVIGKSNNYEKLFDAFDVLPDDKPYDESAFKRSLKGKSYGKYLSDEKANLKSLILRAMQIYHSDRTAEGRVTEMIQEARFLYSKGMVDSCQAHCERAWKIAEHHEIHEAQLQIIKLMRLIDKSAYDISRDRNSERSHLLEQEVRDSMTVERELYYTKERTIYWGYSDTFSLHSSELESTLSRCKELLGQDSLTMLARQHATVAYSTIMMHSRKYEEAIELCQKLISLWELSPDRILEQPTSYQYALHNCLAMLLLSERFEEMPDYLEKLKNIQVEEPLKKASIFMQYSQMYILYYINTNQYKEAMAIIPELNKGLKTHEKNIPATEKINLMGNLSLVYLHNKEFKLMLKAIEEVYTMVARRKDFRHKIRDLKYIEFAAHYETGSIEILDSHLRNSDRYLNENDLHNDFTKVVLKNLKLLAFSDPDKKTSVRAKVRQEIYSHECPNDTLSLKGFLINWL